MLPRRKHPAFALRLARTLCGLALAAALGVTGASAQPRDFEVAVQGRMLSMELGGHLVTIPGPLWTVDAGSAETQKSQIIYKQLGNGVESVLFLPIGENVVTWTRMMGVMSVGRRGYIAAYHVASMVEPLLKSCTPGQALITKVEGPSGAGRNGFVMMCGRYLPSAEAPRSCAAGMLVAIVVESGEGAMKAYDEWCTQSFDAKDRATWPVPAADLERDVGELLAATRFLPLGSTPAARPAVPMVTPQVAK